MSTNIPLPVLIATLRRTTQPVIVVEGGEDSTIYQWIEGFAAPMSSVKSPKVQPVKGRTKVEALYKDYVECTSEYQNAMVFIADRDEDVFDKVPSAPHHDIIWTTGYSIENDLYAGINLENYLNPAENEEFQKILNSIIDWFTIAIQRRQKGEKGVKISVDLDELVPAGHTRVIPRFRPPGITPIPALYHEIRTEYKLKIRGKLLFDLLARFLSRAGRKPWHCRLSLFETAL